MNENEMIKKLRQAISSATYIRKDLAEYAVIPALDSLKDPYVLAIPESSLLVDDFNVIFLGASRGGYRYIVGYRIDDAGQDWWIYWHTKNKRIFCTRIFRPTFTLSKLSSVKTLSRDEIASWLA